MPASNGDVREDVVRDMREEIRGMVGKGMSVEEIARRVNGHRSLTEAELGLIELLTHHAVAEVKGRY
jgi:phosphoserine aminotransferase